MSTTSRYETNPQPFGHPMIQYDTVVCTSRLSRPCGGKDVGADVRVSPPALGDHKTVEPNTLRERSLMERDWVAPYHRGWYAGGALIRVRRSKTYIE